MIYFYLFVGVIVAVLFFKKPFWAFLVLIALIPFHAFIVTFGTHLWHIKSSENTFLASWKEFILAILFLRIVYDSVKAREFPFKILWLDKLIVVLFILAAASILYGTKNLSQGLWGLRYDFEMFLVYAIVRALNFDKKQIKIVLATILGSGLIVAIFAIVQSLFLSPDFLARCCGYSYLKDWIPTKPLQASQVVTDSAGHIKYWRVISTMPGPNQLGIYLAVLALLATSIIALAGKFRYRWYLIFLPLLFIFALYFTYSRSAILSLAAGLIALIILILNRKQLINFIYGAIAAVAVILIVGFVWFFKTDFFKNIFLRIGSSGDHFARVLNSLKVFASHPFGLGVGKAGLVSARFVKNGVLINESWHLQILDELGFVGFIVYVAILWEILKNLFQGFKNSTDLAKIILLGTFSIFIATIVQGFFLHTWTDITLVIIVWTLIGISINYSVKVKEAK